MTRATAGLPRLAGQIAAWGLFALGVGFILLRAVIAPRPEVDFRFFWLAGYLWGHGLDPYSADYHAVSATVLPAGNVTSAWVYPPHWWAICRLLAAASLDHALAAWRLLSGAMLVGGTWWLAQTLFVDRRQAATLVAAGAAGLVCLIEPTATGLALGQNAAVLYLGLCLLIIGFVRGSLPVNVLAILLLSLKPQFGLPLILALLMVRRYWLPVALATGLGLLLALPQLIPFGPGETFREWLGNLTGYSGAGLAAVDNANAPVACTGLMNLAGHVLPIETTAPGFVLGILLSLVAGLWIRKAPPERQGEALTLLVCVAVSIIPLHSYDLVVLGVPVLMLLRTGRAAGLAALAAVVLAIRPGKVEAMLGVPLYGDGVSAGAIGLSLAALLLLVLALRTQFPDRCPAEV